MGLGGTACVLRGIRVLENACGLCVAVISPDVLVFIQKNGFHAKEFVRTPYFAKLAHINVINSAASEFTTFGNLCGKPSALGSSENYEFGCAGLVFEGVETTGAMAIWANNCISHKSVSNTAL